MRFEAGALGALIRVLFRSDVARLLRLLLLCSLHRLLLLRGLRAPLPQEAERCAGGRAVAAVLVGSLGDHGAANGAAHDGGARRGARLLSARLSLGRRSALCVLHRIELTLLRGPLVALVLVLLLLLRRSAGRRIR